MKRKTCPRCNTDKDISLFSKCRSRKDGLDTWCKECRKNAERERNQADPTRSSRKNKASYQRRKHKIKLAAELTRGIIDWLKTDEGCAVTEKRENLVYHHLDPSTKEFDISSSYTRAWDKLLPEIEKCVPVNDEIHGKIHSILDGDTVTEFPAELVGFMEKHYSWTHDGESWRPMFELILTSQERQVRTGA